MFIGAFTARIRRDKILLPSVFVPDIINEKFHLYCIKSDRENHYYLRLEPDDVIKRITEEEKRMLAIEELKKSFFYFGAAGLSQKGWLFIPQEARELIELAPNGDAIFIGMCNAIELWSKKNWDIEKKHLRLYNNGQ